MSGTRDERGGVVGSVFLVILAALLAFFTYTLASDAMARGDRTQLAISALPGVVTFLLAGILIIIVVEGRREQVIAGRRAVNPDQPWLWTDDWRDGHVRSATLGGTAAVFTVFAGLWNAGAAVAVSQQTDLSRAPGLALVVIIGLALIVVAGYKVLLARKYPAAVFDMSTVPGILGGRLGGAIQLPPPVPAGAEARVKLECERIQRNAHRGPRSKALWQDERTLTVPDGGRLPVEFIIPFDLPPSEPPLPSADARDLPISWTLTVTARVPGVDYLATFSVPVFRTAASDASLLREPDSPPKTRDAGKSR
jgi:hypothetical protein